MNTKVRGDKIKEGSIPLSALNYSQIAFIPYCDNTWEMNLTQKLQAFHIYSHLHTKFHLLEILDIRV